MKYRNRDSSFGSNTGEQVRLARAKRESALPIGPLKGDVSPLNTFMDSGGKKGFTLIELLIVVAIIAILSSLAVVNFLQATERSKRAVAKSFIAQLGTAISMYKIDHGYYPSDKNGSASLKEALSPTLASGADGDSKKKDSYMEFNGNQVNNYGELLDPWNEGKDDRIHIYYYRANLDKNPLTVPPFHNRSSYDIYCKGRDGKTGSDDISGNESGDGYYSQNGLDDDEDGFIDELDPNGPGSSNGYLEDDINNW